MSKFPYDYLALGDPIMCRRVTHKGEREEDADFGTWKLERVTHIQRDRQGIITCLQIGGWVEFDPRAQYEDGGPYPSLVSEQYQLQFLREEAAS